MSLNFLSHFLLQVQPKAIVLTDYCCPIPMHFFYLMKDSKDKVFFLVLLSEK